MKTYTVKMMWDNGYGHTSTEAPILYAFEVTFL